jgi:hypothetical protein
MLRVNLGLGIGQNWRSIASSLLAALALLTAPAVGTLQRACNQCPPTCPMHRPVKAKKDKPSCHSQGSVGRQAGHHRADQSSSMPTYSRPPCGHNGAIPGVAMGPMVLPNGTSVRHYVTPTEYMRREGNLRVRFREPPEPPPPILSS